MSNAGHGPIIISCSGIPLLVFSTAFVALRLAARFSRKTDEADIGDLFLGLGWVFGVSLTVLAINGSLAQDYANHISQITKVADQVNALFYSWVEEILFLFGLSCVKISIFFFYHTLAIQLSNRKLIWTLRCFIITISMFMVTYLVLPLAGCKPLEASWRKIDPTYKEPYACVNGDIAAIVADVINCITDFSAGAIPLVVVQLLKKPLKAKAGLICLLMLGFMVFAAGLARMITARELLGKNSDDPTWGSAMVQLAAMYELHLAITYACAPFIYRAYRLVWKEAESTSLNIRFMHGRSLHATKKLNNRLSDDSLKEQKSPPPMKSLQSSLPILVTNLQVPKLGEDNRNVLSEKHTGKRKATPILQLDKPLLVEKKSLESDCEITVAYQPSQRQTSMRDLEEAQSPTLPPESRYRLSGLSWITGGGRKSHWSGPRTPGTEIRRQSTGGRTTPKSPTSPSRESFTLPRSPGLSSIDVSEQPEVPPRAKMRQIDPALNPGYVACRGCGQYHPYGFRHRDIEIQDNLRFGFWRKKNGRQSQSTFFDDRDDDDDDDIIVV